MKTFWKMNTLCLLAAMALLLLSACVGGGKEEQTTLDRNETQAEIPVESEPSKTEPQSVTNTSEPESEGNDHPESTTDDQDEGWFAGWY